MDRIGRRRFLLRLSWLASVAAFLPVARLSGARNDKLGEALPIRTLGRTGEQVTMLGLGGYHFGALGDRDAQAMIETAIESGVRFFDTAVLYQSGGSEQSYGKHLVPRYRDDIFLMTKTLGRDAGSVRKDLEDSLRRLRTDRLDLWQAHSIESPEDAKKRATQGVFDEMLKAKDEGKVRHIGFTGHKLPEGHLAVLEATDAMETCQMPVNAVDRGYRSFIENVMPRLVDKNLGIIAMKTLADQGFFGRNRWVGRPTGVSPLIPDRITVEEAMYFVWSLPVSVLVTGAETVEQLLEKVNLARRFGKLNDTDRDRIFAKVADLAGKQVEFYKA